MPIENSKTSVRTKAGMPNYKKLNDEGRLPKPVAKNGSPFDPNPTPTENIQGTTVSRGYAREADGIWRVGLSPESYHQMVELSNKKKEQGKDWDFLPELYDAEREDYAKWLAKASKNA